MKITDPALLAAILSANNCGILDDGLFTVVGQTHLIEMHTQRDFDQTLGLQFPKIAFVIRTSEVFGDGIMNSACMPENETLYDFFTDNVEDHVFDTHEEAMQFYFGYITKHNHLA